MLWKTNRNISSDSEKIVCQPPSNEKIVRGSSSHNSEKETYQTPQTSEKEPVSGYPSSVQPTPAASHLPPPQSLHSSPRELPQENDTHHESCTSDNEIGSSHTPVQCTPRAPVPPASSSNAKEVTNSRSMTKCSEAVITMVIIIVMVLVKLTTFSGSIHAEECVLSSSSSNFTGPIIAVMGATGTGKSSLIRDLQGRDSKGCLPKIGHGLESCTRNVTWYSSLLNERAFTILDTPGFDDIALSDSSILQNLATELASIHQGKRHLAGLIYLNDVSKVKMGRTSYKNLQLFQKLVASQSLKNVILVTTPWSSTNDRDSHRREQELKESFWKPMIKQGSQVYRHQSTVDSAQLIVSTLLGKPHMVPKITDELVRQKLSFSQTEAGKMVDENLKAFGTEMKDEIKIINAQLKDMTKQRAHDALEADKERAKLAKELQGALQEAARKDEVEQELQALAHRLAKERRERLKDMEDLKKEKERYEQLLKDTARSQKQLKESLKTKSTSFGSFGNFAMPSYPVRTISGFPRFVGFSLWLLETITSIGLVIYMLGKGAPLTPILMLWCLFWLYFSYLFLSIGPNTLTIFLVVSVFIFALSFGMHGVGYNTGVSHGINSYTASITER